MSIELGALLPALGTLDPLTDLYAQVDAGRPARLGVPDSAKPASAALLWRRTRRPLLLVVPREVDAESIVEQVRAWVGDAAMLFPGRAALPFSRDGHDPDVAWER
ncbi:MAG: hypothetical protein O2798_07240, partial [Chloroflexi bacterium]|nr:hypothetical protein [Chloroflexota bacterium]